MECQIDQLEHSAFSDPEIGDQPEAIPVINTRTSFLESEKSTERKALQSLETVAFHASQKINADAFNQHETGAQSLPELDTRKVKMNVGLGTS